MLMTSLKNSRALTEPPRLTDSACFPAPFRAEFLVMILKISAACLLACLSMHSSVCQVGKATSRGSLGTAIWNRTHFADKYRPAREVVSIRKQTKRLDLIDRVPVPNFF